MTNETKLPYGLSLADNLLAESEYISEMSDCARSAIRAEHTQRLTLQHHAADQAQRVADLERERDTLRTRLAELERQEPAGWRPIETAPKDGERVLLRWSGYRRPCVGVWCMDFGASKPTPHWSGDSDRLFGLREARKLQPTHWMPIPTAPEAAR